jgi:hypothetical protein
MHFVGISEQTAIISLSTTNWRIFSRVRKIAKANTLSSRLSARKEKLGSYWTDFYEN